MPCPSCEPDYCACADFYAGRLAYWKGEMMTPERNLIAEALRQYRSVFPDKTRTRCFALVRRPA